VVASLIVVIDEIHEEPAAPAETEPGEEPGDAPGEKG
jgi:hypothetical protein